MWGGCDKGGREDEGRMKGVTDVGRMRGLGREMEEGKGWRCGVEEEGERKGRGVGRGVKGRGRGEDKGI